jgi:hypothetical protein
MLEGVRVIHPPRLHVACEPVRYARPKISRKKNPIHFVVKTPNPGLMGRRFISGICMASTYRLSIVLRLLAN